VVYGHIKTKIRTSITSERSVAPVSSRPAWGFRAGHLIADRIGLVRV
jgi:hypothetical protein